MRAQGGFVVDTTALRHRDSRRYGGGTLHGYWGFDPYQAPTFHLVNARRQPWALPAAIRGAGGRARRHRASDGGQRGLRGSASCSRTRPARNSRWIGSRSSPTAVEVKLPLEDAAPGPMTLLVSQYGAADTQQVALQHVQLKPAHLGGFVIHAGDVVGTLTARGSMRWRPHAQRHRVRTRQSPAAAADGGGVADDGPRRAGGGGAEGAAMAVRSRSP